MVNYKHETGCICDLVNSCRHEIVKRRNPIYMSGVDNSFEATTIYRIHVAGNVVWGCRYDVLGEKCIRAVKPFDIGRYFVESELEIVKEPTFDPNVASVDKEEIDEVITMQADETELKKGRDSRILIV